MKVHRLLLVVGGLISTIAVCGGALSLCDYVSPETSISRMRLSFNYQYSYDAVDEVVEVNRGRAGLDYTRIFDSPDFGYSMSARGQLTLSELMISEGLARSSGTVRHYLDEEQPVFAFAGASSTVEVMPIDPTLNVTAGMGYGRFTDVTPLAKALRIQGLLLRREVLPATLAEQTLMNLAQEIGRHEEYATAEDLAEALVLLIEEEAGVQVDPRSVLAVEDIVVQTDDERFCGWDIQAGLSYQVLDTQGLQLAASASLALPPTPESQILFQVNLSGPFNIAAHHIFDLSASYEYVGAPANVNAEFLLTRKQLPEEDPRLSASGTLELGFLVGRTSVGLEFVLTKAAEATNLSVQIGISASLRLL